ncbi:hypothetical protein LX99_03242 [Mucilaginibacter oryzae]|uniref:Uncharacterized protein n=1 Tax=Mucilaginibacter oryzae TaxID=468058 RepID=A0A316H8F8_9SPHI|nr:hypothetical protein LX99_03242 [Mucilaginibacter oryzae]
MITTAITPVIAPALKIPVMTEQLLNVNNIKATNKKCKFFMVDCL